MARSGRTFPSGPDSGFSSAVLCLENSSRRVFILQLWGFLNCSVDSYLRRGGLLPETPVSISGSVEMKSDFGVYICLFLLRVLSSSRLRYLSRTQTE